MKSSARSFEFQITLIDPIVECLHQGRELNSLRETVLGTSLDEKTRNEGFQAALDLVRVLERPEEIVMRQSFESHIYSLCLRLGVDLRLFHILDDAGKNFISATRLAELSGAETQFIVRIMRVLTALDYAREVVRGVYAQTPLTKAVTTPALEACVIHSFEHAATVCWKMPDYFRVHGYQFPDHKHKGPFQAADLTYFEFLQSDHRKLKNFNTFMTGNRGSRKHWTEWLPVREILLGDLLIGTTSSDEVILVDMGGGLGHDLERFIETFPESRGHLVLEDLPETIAALKDFKGDIRPISHDLFGPQPILGAKAYYTHFLLHDFPDQDCRQILQHVKTAMEPGYSRLLLNETIIPNEKCPSFFAAGDITMMAVLAGMKRSEQQWRDLLESVGFEVVKVWSSPDFGDSEGVVEAIVSRKDNIEH